MLPRAAAPRLTLLLVVAGFGGLVWTALPRLENSSTWVWDQPEFVNYAGILKSQHRLPTRQENYEFSLPPGMPVLAVAVEGAARVIGPVDVRPFAILPRAARLPVWLALVLTAGALLVGAEGGRRRRTAGIALAALALAVAALHVVSTTTSFPGAAGVLPDIVAGVGLVVVSALLARELWPEHAWAPPLAAFGATLVPVVFRGSLVFHPDPVFAFFAASALLVAVRAARRDWSVRDGIACGLLLALSALTRQSGAVAILAVALSTILVGRRAAVRFVAAGAAALALVAGPWWAYQTVRFGNPIKSNLNRPGLMLDHEPASFYFTVPGELVTNPWRVTQTNYLLPRFHVTLWSDWTGHGAYVTNPSSETRALASSQSVLGFGGDALALGGLLFIGLPSLWRIARQRAPTRLDEAVAALAIFVAVSWVAFVAMQIRFPQQDGDPDQAHYLLFIAPACVLLGLAAAKALWARGRWGRVAVAGWTGLYAASWAIVLTTML